MVPVTIKIREAGLVHDEPVPLLVINKMKIYDYDKYSHKTVKPFY